MMNRALYLILLVVGFIWSRSSWGKLAEGKFVGGLGATLEKFASKNPYPWYKDFLENVAVPNSTTFGYLTMYGEAFAALAITLSAVILLFKKSVNSLVLIVLSLGLATGAFLNAVFWLASGWTSPSTDGLNLLMFAIELIALWAIWRKNS